MCGRFVLAAPPAEVRNLFGYADEPDFPPRYNIAPTQPIATVRLEEGVRRFRLVRWGLVPGWAKDPAALSLLVNARAETAAQKPSFRAAMRHRRCLVPASGYYEWYRPDTGQKVPYWIRPRDGGILALAGLWEDWCDPDGGVIDTGALLTVPANHALSGVHNRMPAVIRPEHFDLWLDVKNASAKEVRALLRPLPDDFLEAIPVDTRVNAARADDPDLIREAEPEVAAPEPAPRKRKTAGGGAPGGDQLDLF